MASDLRYQFLQTLSDESNDDKHVIIRLCIALDETNTIRDVSHEIHSSVVDTC